MKDNAEDAKELTEEVERGHTLARQLTEHVLGMGAAEYTGKVQVSGRTWEVRIRLVTG
jgi:predicted deacylase